MTTATIEAEDFFTAWQLELDAHLLVLAQAGRGKDHLIRRTTDRIIDDLAGSVRIIGTGHYRLTTVHPNALVSTDPHIALLAINAELDEMARRYDAITAGEPKPAPRLVIIDDFQQLLYTLNTYDRCQFLDRIDDLISLGRSAGMHVVIVSDHTPTITVRELSQMAITVLGRPDGMDPLYDLLKTFGVEIPDTLPIGHATFHGYNRSGVTIRLPAPRMARLAIADPPYLGRANRWYGTGRGHASGTGKPDHHDHAATWDHPATHLQLLDRLQTDYDGWALAAAPATLGLYLSRLDEQLRAGGVRVAVWHRGNAVPSGSRIASQWEPVIVRIPAGRSAHGTDLAVSDVLTAGIPYRSGFVGRKPDAWTRWVLELLGFRSDDDSLDDLFLGSGSVTAAADGRLAFPAPMPATA